MTQASLTVDLNERSYKILIGHGLLAQPQSWLPEGAAKRSVFLITDSHVRPLYANALLEQIRPLTARVHLIEVFPGERSKSYTVYERVLEEMIANGLTRQSLVIALGGGIVGDLAGFVAATAMRGIDFIQIPTTLLSQVDSSVGGKTGINSPQGKNLIGAFYQPKKVIIDLRTLQTLPLREQQAGYAEIVKYGLLGNAVFFEWLESNGERVLAGDSESLTYAILTSCRMKADIVRQDEREEIGLRARLNLGHTFAHALETAAGYDGRLLHGEAVGIGLVLAARLSARLGFLSEMETDRIASHFKSVGMKTEIRDVMPRLDVSPEEILSLMFKDKKATADGLTFVVMNSIGSAEIKAGVSPDLVLEILKESI
jgi:3-dehydroquinate synthase